MKNLSNICQHQGKLWLAFQVKSFEIKKKVVEMKILVTID